MGYSLAKAFQPPEPSSAHDERGVYRPAFDAIYSTLYSKMKLRNPLHALLDLIEPICWAIIKACFASRLSTAEFGECRFYGEPAWAELFQRGMQKLKEIDHSLYANIICDKMILMRLPHGIEYRWGYNRRYTIDKWFCENGIDGFIFGIVMYHFHNRENHKYGWFKSHFFDRQERVLDGLAEAVDWLRSNGFNEESIAILEKMWYKRKGMEIQNG